MFLSFEIPGQELLLSNQKSRKIRNFLYFTFDFLINVQIGIMNGIVEHEEFQVSDVFFDFFYSSVFFHVVFLDSF